MFNEAERRRLEIGYLKTSEGLEVDFLVRDPSGGPPELLQVCADPTPEGTRTRELRALAAAAPKTPRAVAKLLVLTHDQTLPFAGTSVQAMAAYEWLL